MHSKIDELTDAIDDVERERKANNVIIHGLNIRFYAEIASNTEQNSEGSDIAEPKNPDASIVRILKFTNQLGADIPKADTRAIFTMKKGKAEKSTASVLVKFNNHQAKVNLLRKKKELKNTEHSTVFINDDLTPNNANLMKKARGLKKSGSIENEWTKDGRVYVKKNNGNIVTIKKEEQLTKFTRQDG